MAVQGDTCLFSVLQTSSLNSCYVWIKRTGSGSLAAPTRSVTLNCIPCQLQTRCVAEEVTGLTPLSLSLYPVSYLLPFVCFTGHSISMPPTPCITVKEKTEWCTEDTSQSDGGTFFEYSNKTQGLSCQITLTPSVKIPATSPWSREADVLSLPSSSGQSCQDLLVKDTEDSTDGKNDLSEVQLVSLSEMSFMRRNNKLCCKCCWSIHPEIIPSAPNKFFQACLRRLPTFFHY